MIWEPSWGLVSSLPDGRVEGAGRSQAASHPPLQPSTAPSITCLPSSRQSLRHAVKPPAAARKAPGSEIFTGPDRDGSGERLVKTLLNPPPPPSPSGAPRPRPPNPGGSTPNLLQVYTVHCTGPRPKSRRTVLLPPPGHHLEVGKETRGTDVRMPLSGIRPVCQAPHSHLLVLGGPGPLVSWTRTVPTFHLATWSVERGPCLDQ